MLQRSRALVLHTLKYDDDRLICALLTEESGFVSVVVRRPRSRRSGVPPALLQPFSALVVEWDERAKSELYPLRSAAREAVWADLPYHAVKRAQVMFLSEVLYHVLRREQSSPALYAFVRASLEWLDAAQRGIANFHIVFLLRLTRFAGFFPNLDEAAGGGWFDLQSGSFAPRQPLHPYFLPPAEARLLPRLMRMQYATMHLFRMSAAERRRLLAHLADYYRLHVPGLPELRSPEVLAEVFG